MPYSPIRFGNVADPDEREIFNRASNYLADVYTMLHARPRKGSNGGECNLTSVLVLACIIDALSIHIFPKTTWANTLPCNTCGQPLRGKDDAERRFKMLIREKMHWEVGHPRWYDRDQSAVLIYDELRNLLVHELGKDRPSSARPLNASQTVAGRWGRLPKSLHRMDRVDAIKNWNSAWPVLEYKRATTKQKAHIKVCCAALYWLVKKMTQRLADERVAVP